MGSESLTGTDGAEAAGRQLQSHPAHDEEHRHAPDTAPAGHFDLPGRRAMTWWFAAFTVYAGVTILTRHADGTWAAWACGGYAVTTVLLLVTRNWVLPLAAAAGGALIAPLLWLITKAAPTGEVVVISQSASYLLKHGTPYLPQSLLVGWESYNPYLPFMEIFGLPRSAGLGSVVGDPRIWTTLVTIVALAAAFTVVSPHRIRDCRQCRNRLVWLTTVAGVSPVIAFPLSVGVTDPPVIALTCLTLALAYRGRLVGAGLVLALACAMKTTAWAVIPVLGVMAWVRYSPGAAARFAASAIGLTVVLAAVGAPAALASRSAINAVKQNLIEYPLGATKFKTPAQSPLPGHLIAELGKAGHAAALALMIIAVLAFVAWLLLRPPRDVGDVTFRLAVGYAALFTLDPSTRFGYYAYPLALLGWLALTPSETGRPALPWLAALADRLPRRTQ
ncbi:MAG TPA: glycosyltransferase 87 family protein [Trebonia sp.]|nr:glycosyltransferase 87 family protein [Trebonia sp.]